FATSCRLEPQNRVDFRSLREKELENVYSIQFTGLDHAKEHKRLLERPFTEQAVSRPLELHEVLHCMLSTCVIPRNVVVVQEGEQLAARLLESLLIPERDL